jgi:hypothetical protein
MQNSHLRLGQLEYQRSSVKTDTHIAVHVSHYVGEKEQAHLLSYFGNDAEVAAVTAAIQENHQFHLRFPEGSKQKIGFGADASCYKGNLSLPQHKKSLRHVIAVSSWLRANGSAGGTFILHDEAQTEELVWPPWLVCSDFPLMSVGERTSLKSCEVTTSSSLSKGLVVRQP